MKNHCACAAFCLVAVLAVTATAADQPQSPPTWWQQYGITLEQPVDPDRNPNQLDDGTVVTVEELRNWATDAQNYLDDTLAADGGAGQLVADAIASLDDSDPAVPATVRQFQSVMQPIYDRLNAIGYDTQTGLQAYGATTDWNSKYPWPHIPAGSGDPAFDAGIYAIWQKQQAAPISFEQIKFALSFDLTDFTSMTKIVGPADGGIALGKKPSSGNASDATGNLDIDADGAAAKNVLADSSMASSGSTLGMQTADNSALALVVLTPLE